MRTAVHGRGEPVACGGADVVDAWMQSSGHRQNIEEPAFTQATTSCVLDGGRVLCSLLLTGP